MANHTSRQRIDDELKKFIRQVYPGKSITKATKQLAEDLWDELIYGKKIKTKYKDKFK